MRGPLALPEEKLWAGTEKFKCWSLAACLAAGHASNQAGISGTLYCYSPPVGSGVRIVSSTSVTLSGPRKWGKQDLNPDPLICTSVLYVHHVDVHTVCSHSSWLWLALQLPRRLWYQDSLALNTGLCYSYRSKV